MEEFLYVSRKRRGGNTREELQSLLKTTADNTERATKVRTTKKLSQLYGGFVMLPEASEGFVNLSSIELTDSQKELMNLGFNCHVQGHYDKLAKKAELEELYQNIQKLKREERIEVNTDLKEQLLCESTKHRNQPKSRLLTPDLRTAAHELRNNDDITIRRADKSSNFVIMDKTEYLDKMDAILSDKTKFTTINRDPTKTNVVKINKLIDAANAASGDLHFSRITGEYSPGYAYGNVKTHKTGNPLRPIISQIPTPTYQLAKKLNTLILPYIPSDHCLESTDEFLSIVRNHKPTGLLASLDVESLFTSVPVQETIDLILSSVYDHPTLPPLKTPKTILGKLLSACTMESPFRGPNGKLYRQIDGIAMGSPLGCLFANMYMCHLENKVLDAVKPVIYCRYVDDIFAEVDDEAQLLMLKNTMERESCLRFTTEISVENRIPFLDIDISQEDGTLKTKVYRKPTNTGRCMNGKSECPTRYKNSVIRSFIQRALKYCSDWNSTHQELQRCKQLLINNGYTNTDVDAEIQKQMNRIQHPKQNKNKEQVIQVFYKNQMSPSYRVDERVLRGIIRKNIKCKQPNTRLQLTIYYKNTKIGGLIMRNNITKDKSDLKSTNVVYQFKCPYEDCQLRLTGDYIGMTTTTLSRRMTMHLQDGAPLQHMKQEHQRALTRQDLTENTTILRRENNRKKLQILEALLIRDKKPAINKQLKSCIILDLF